VGLSPLVRVLGLRQNIIHVQPKVGIHPAPVQEPAHGVPDLVSLSQDVRAEEHLVRAEMRRIERELKVPVADPITPDVQRLLAAAAE